jgi:hypothetical protein
MEARPSIGQHKGRIHARKPTPEMTCKSEEVHTCEKLWTLPQAGLDRAANACRAIGRDPCQYGGGRPKGLTN